MIRYPSISLLLICINTKK